MRSAFHQPRPPSVPPERPGAPPPPLVSPNAGASAVGVPPDVDRPGSWAADWRAALQSTIDPRLAGPRHLARPRRSCPPPKGQPVGVALALLARLSSPSLPATAGRAIAEHNLP